MKRSIAIVAALVGLVVLVPSALADDSTSTISDSTTATTTTDTVTDSGTTTTTEVPETETTTTTTTTTTDVPEITATTTDVPDTTETDMPTIADEGDCMQGCIPTDVAGTCATCVDGAGGIPTGVAGSGALPFTGIEDMIAPILLALTVVLGGVVAWRWAQLRESVARDATQARSLPAKDARRTGYGTALRRQVIEQRARQVFTPRVA